MVSSIETPEGDRCVDLFARPDGSWGFEEFRRDVEDRGEWTAVRYHSTAVYGSKDLALEAAQEAVAWLADRLRETRSGARPVSGVSRPESEA